MYLPFGGMLCEWKKITSPPEQFLKLIDVVGLYLQLNMQ